MMIRTLFFPRKINDKLVFAENHVGIHVDDHTIRVAQVHATRNKRTIKSLEEVAINEGEPKTYNQRLGAALKRLLPKLPKNPHVRVSFPSSQVIIKELTVPFLDAEKIRMVVEYEIEPIIPFKLEEAVVDFIIVEKSEVKGASTILVAAAQIEEVKKFVEVFQKAGIEPSTVTIDTFGLADLFATVPQYAKLKHAYALVDVGTHNTRIALINKHMLVATRTINLGTLAPPTKAGGAPTAKGIAAHQAKLFKEISYTLDSFEIKRSEPIKAEKIFFIGDDEMFSSFENFVSKSLRVPCEKFASEQIAKIPGVINNVGNQAAHWRTYTHALSVTLSSSRYDGFSLRKKTIEVPRQPLIQRQLLTATALLLVLFFTIGIRGYLGVREVNMLITQKQTREVSRLRKVFPPKSPMRKKSSLKALAKEAENYVQEQEEMWAPFSQQRLRPLEILQELTALFNRKKFDIDIQEVIITGDEHEQHPIEVQGLFRSQTGSDHFKHFSMLEEDLRNSRTLVLTEEIDPTPAENGVQFIVHLKQKEVL